MMDNNARPGDVRVYKGQAFACLGGGVLERRDGTETNLIRWQALCMACGAEFTFAVPLHVDTIYPTRRCEEHRPKYQRRKWRRRTA